MLLSKDKCKVVIEPNNQQWIVQENRVYIIHSPKLLKTMIRLRKRGFKNENES